MFGWKTKAAGMNRRSVEISGAFDGGLAPLTHGLMAGTRVASNLGWRSIEALAVGDKVLTFDNGMQRIIEIRRVPMWLDAPETVEAAWPVTVPADALGNRETLTLLPEQGVMVESDSAFDQYGDPFAVLAASALVGLRGIYRRRPTFPVDMIALYFEQEEVIYAEGGALIHCPRDTSTLDKFLSLSPADYEVLNQQDAAYMVACLMAEDAVMSAGGLKYAQMGAPC